MGIKKEKEIYAILMAVGFFLLISVLKPYFLFPLEIVGFLGGIFILNYYFFKNKYWFYIYLLFLFCILFFRNKNISACSNDLSYLLTMLKYAFKNFTLFLNLVGNILLFIPLAYFLYKHIKGYMLYITLIIIICTETAQFLFKVGVFDFGDILLNYFGVLIFYFFARYLRWWKRIKRLN